MIPSLEKILSGGDLRSLGKSNSVIGKIRDQNNFDELFTYMHHKNRLVVMRAADAVEKITARNPEYLTTHEKEIFRLCTVAKNKELKWHLALLVPRLPLTGKAMDKAWNTLTNWAKDKANSRIVRVNSLQGLFELAKINQTLKRDLALTFTEVEKDNIPSITARITKLRKYI